MTNRMLECALEYVKRGWRVIPLHTVNNGLCSCKRDDCSSPGKHPVTFNGSKDATTDTETIKKWFGNGKPLNLGICAGKESGLVILDVDPAHGGDESLKKYNVPDTLEVITGSGGRHFYFSLPEGQTVRNSAGKLGDGLDVRGTNGYCVAPPSMHASGKEYRWKIDPRAKQIAVCPEWLLSSGQQSAISGQLSKDTEQEAGQIQQGQRNQTLTSIAGAMRRKGCDAEAICAALVSINKKRCCPPLEYAELTKIAESVSVYPPEPQEAAGDAIVLKNDHPETIAEEFEKWSEVKHKHHVDTWCVYKDDKYTEVDEREVKKWIRRFARQCRITKRIRTDDGIKTVIVPLKVTTYLVNGTIDALSALDEVWIRPRFAPPSWLNENQNDPEEIIAVNNCLLDISDDEPRRLELTEEFFTLNYLKFDYDEKAECPTWKKFLSEVFTKSRLSSTETKWSPELDDFQEVTEDVPDELSISILQEFMGLLMTQVTKYQKILGIVGPRRSGKGTIARIIRAIAGAKSVASPTLSSLTIEHGLQGLLNKTVALITDASISGARGDTVRAVERLKSISGEDPQQINPKGKAFIQVDKLRVRFVIMANELQKLTDPTGALAGRFIYLITTQSFEGREDTALDGRLLKELPGIFNWCLDGFYRLKQRGHFLESEAGKEAKRTAEELGSPVIAFVREWCARGADKQIKPQKLYEAYRRWTEEAGRAKMGRTRFYEEFQRAFPEHARVRVRLEPDTNPVFMFRGIDLQEIYKVNLM